MEITQGANPKIWAWSPGTGVQYSAIPGNILNIDEVGIIDNVLIYPNPAENFLNIDASFFTENTQITVYSITGKKIIDTSFSNNNNSYKMAVKNLVSGIYILNLSSKSKKKTFKFIKK